MVVRPTPWGKGKSSWGPWSGLVRGIIVSLRGGIKWIFEMGHFGDSDDFECIGLYNFTSMREECHNQVLKV